MNIRRRLFVSNILMIVIPLVASLGVFYAGLWVFTTITGIRDSRELRDGELFFRARMELTALAKCWREDPASPNFGQIVRDVDAFNDRSSIERDREIAADAEREKRLRSDRELRGHKEPGKQRPPHPRRTRRRLMLIVCRGGEVVFPRSLVSAHPDEIFSIAPNEDGGTIVFSGSAAYVEAVGSYRVVLVDGGTLVRDDERVSYRTIMSYGSVFAVVCSVFIILVTNQFLTRAIFRSIVSSIDTIVCGVRAIRDGDLGFRIRYDRDDEFAAVASDFNDMACRLEASVEAKRRDETSRRELIAGISHDLRTPLTSIKAYVEGLQQGVASTPEAREKYITTIMNKADDLEHIIEMLFLFSKLDTDEFPFQIERASPGAVVSETVAAMQDEYGSDAVSITFADGSCGAAAEIDVVQFRSALINIIGNSVKYCDLPRAEIDVTVSADDSEIALTVSDNGPGVPADKLDKIFDVFYRGDPARREPSKGSGLGLAIAKKMISRFGGRIWAEKHGERGLDVKMLLPRAYGSVRG